MPFLSEEKQDMPEVYYA